MWKSPLNDLYVIVYVVPNEPTHIDWAKINHTQFSLGLGKLTTAEGNHSSQCVSESRSAEISQHSRITTAAELWRNGKMNLTRDRLPLRRRSYTACPCVRWALAWSEFSFAEYQCFRVFAHARIVSALRSVRRSELRSVRPKNLSVLCEGILGVFWFTELGPGNWNIIIG